MIPVRAGGALRAFAGAGVLSAADVHVALRLLDDLDAGPAEPPGGASGHGASGHGREGHGRPAQ